MKKLMTVAAVALAGSVMAAAPAGDAYQIKMTLKTTKAANIGDAPGECLNPLGNPGCKVRVADTYNVVAWAWGCYDTCNDLATFAADNTKFNAWDTKHKVYFYNNDGLTAKPTMNFDILQKIGKKFTEAEARFQATWYADSLVATKAQKFTLMGTGFGKFNTSKQVYSSLSGNVVGWMTPPYYNTTDKAFGYTCASVGCTGGTPTIGNDTVIYGKWSAKFNSSAAAKVAKANGTLPASYFPNY